MTWVKTWMKVLDRHAFWVIWIAGTALRLAQILASRPHLGRDLSELELTARSVILHGTLGNPYLRETGPGAHVAPVAPLLLAALYAIFGMEGAGQIAQRFAGALAASAQYALLPAAAEALGLRRTVGIAAGLLGALIPYKGYIETVDTPWEQPYVALVCVLLFVHTARYWKSGGSAVMRGVYWGLAILLSPTFLPVFLVVLVYELAHEYVSQKRKGREGAAPSGTGTRRLVAPERVRFARVPQKRKEALLVTMLCSVLVLLPWIARNWVQLGGLVPVRTNFGLEFSLSNREGARPLMEDNVSRGEFTQFHPAHNEAEWRKLREQGELAYNHELRRAALLEVMRDPLRFLQVTGERVWRFWLWPSHRTGTMLATLLFTILGVAGVRKVPASDARTLLGLILLAYPLVYYVIQVDRRYRYPLEWIFLVGAAALVMEKLGRRVS